MTIMLESEVLIPSICPRIVLFVLNKTVFNVFSLGGVLLQHLNFSHLLYKLAILQTSTKTILL